MASATEAVARGLQRRIASSGGSIQRRGAAVFGYFGVSNPPGPVRLEISAALKDAGVALDPALDSAGADQLLRLYLDPLPLTASATGTGSGTPDPPALPARVFILPDLVDMIAPAVVHITAANGQGSGFALDPDGFLVTNAHVVGEHETVQVKFREGQVHEGVVTGIDLATDLAVLRVSEQQPSTLSFAPLKSVRVGESVVAVGSPMGLEWSVTAGIVSGTNRTMQGPDGLQIDYMIQTDAEINPGNSGGPLVALDGHVIGVNSAGLVGRAIGGLNFAIPSDTAQTVYEEIREHGAVRRAVIGARATAAPFFGEEADRWGQEGGATLTKVVAGAPANRAGLVAGDIVISLDGELVDEPGDLFRLLSRERIGRECAIRFLRDEEILDRSITPEARE